MPPEAKLICRIFRDYAAGVSPKALVRRLNAEHCPGPGGKPWNPSTNHGNPARCTGILNNELYIGRLVWNRLRYVMSIKNELLSLEARKAELQSRLNAPEMPELLHPRIADVYREKVGGSLSLALESEESRTGAVEGIRALIEAILLEPDGDRLKTTLKGDPTVMLSAARDSKRSPDTGDLMVK